MASGDDVDISGLDEEILSDVYEKIDEKNKKKEEKQDWEWNQEIKQAHEKREDKYAPQVNFFFFIFLGIPLLSEYFGFFWFYRYEMYSIIIHEVGHFVFGTIPYVIGLGNRTLGSAGGCILQISAPLITFLFLSRNHRTYFIAGLFLLAAGIDIIDTGQYMSSALDPWGKTSFYGAIRGQRGDMNEQNHDFSVVFRRTGLIMHSKEIGAYTILLGETIASVGLASVFLGFIHLIGLHQFEGYSRLIAYAGLLSFLYYTLTLWLIQAGISLIFTGSYLAERALSKVR
ncbi:MAG: hypothetical protein ABH950_00285 [Candidatus Altiarchaeota archaeon]